MATTASSLFASDPPGFNDAVVAGDCVALRFFIPKKPKEEGRVRGRVVQGKRPYVQFYPDPATKDWKDEVSELVGHIVRALPGDFVLPLDGRVVMSIRYNLHKPVSYSKAVEYPVVKPDVDNLEKSILDSLVQGGILKDDNIITDVYHCKRYETWDHPLGIEIDLTVTPTVRP